MGGAISHRLAAFLCALLTSTSLLAQQAEPAPTNRDRDPTIAQARDIASRLQRASYRIGRFYLLSELHLGDVDYTEQFYVPAEEGRDGLTLSVSAPQRLYYVPHRKVVLGAEVTPSYAWLTGDQDDQFHYGTRGDAMFLFNHLFVDVYASRSERLRARYEDINRLMTVENDRFGVDGELKYSSRTSMRFSSSYDRHQLPRDEVQPDDVPVELLNGHTHRNRVALIHRTFPLTSLSVAGELNNYDFSLATYKDSRRIYAAPGFFYDGVVKLRAEAGPARLDFRDPAQQDFTGLLGNFDATRETRRVTYRLAAGRDVGHTVFAANNYYVVTRGTASVSFGVGRGLQLRVQSLGERYDYEVPVGGRERRDTVSFSTVGFIYTFRRLAAGIDAGYYRRASNFGVDENDGIRYVVHLSFTP